MFCSGAALCTGWVACALLLATSDGEGCGPAGSGVADGAVSACCAGAWVVACVESALIRVWAALEAI